MPEADRQERRIHRRAGPFEGTWSGAPGSSGPQFEKPFGTCSAATAAWRSRLVSSSRAAQDQVPGRSLSSGSPYDPPALTKGHDGSAALGMGCVR